jgi:formylglycine-generating enzyme required for sulfatase activity
MLKNAADAWPSRLVTFGSAAAHDLVVEVARGDALCFIVKRNSAAPASKVLWDPAVTYLPDAERARVRAGQDKELALDLGGGVKLELVRIPAGTFLMGSPATEAQRGSDEAPPHAVTFSRPFYMGKCGVTQAQYEQVMGANPSHFKGAQNPVEGVAWGEAQDFCRKVSAMSGVAVRLPTEAEREYACRAGSTTAYSFGDSADGLAEYAWYRGNSGNTTHPVGEKKPNAWGLYDMHGNVWEWCQDRYGDAYYAENPPVDPQGPAQGAHHVVRGGSWDGDPEICRSAFRGWNIPFNRDEFLVGLRVVVEVPKTP